MSVVIIRQDGKTEAWKKALQALAPDIKFYNYLEEHPKEAIEAGMVWKHPQGIFAQYPALQYIASFGAGVDFLMEDPEISENLPITRVVDPYLASDMSEFVISAILSYLKNFNRYQRDQIEKIWNPLPYKRIADYTVGIMGLGELGRCLANDLNNMGFKVIGYSNSIKKLNYVESFAGETQRVKFLSQSQILVCLLPLTDTTRGILNKSLFSELPEGAYVINVARGGHLVDEDLISMLDNGHLSGACLDVYHEEPLPVQHPFWTHPKIFMTPHIASVSDIEAVVPQLIENYRRFKSGLPLLNQVSTIRGY